MVPGRDIEWELRVPPFRLGPASELIRQINERWAYVGARPLSVPVCHLFVRWMLAQSDSGQPFSVAAIPLHPSTRTGAAATNVGCFGGTETVLPITLWNCFCWICSFFFFFQEKAPIWSSYNQYVVLLPCLVFWCLFNTRLFVPQVFDFHPPVLACVMCDKILQRWMMRNNIIAAIKVCMQDLKNNKYFFSSEPTVLCAHMCALFRPTLN